MKVVTQDGQTIDLPEQEALAAYDAGKVGIVRGQDIPVRSISGQVGTVKAENLGSALSEGYSLSTPEELRKATLEAKYDNGMGALGAGAAGLLRGASVGLFDPLAAALGGEKAQQALSDLRETFPTLSLGTELFGAVAPALATGGASLPEQAEAGLLRGAARTGFNALTAPARGVARLGQAAEALTARALPEATSFGGRLATRAIPMAAQGATEGALYGAGQAISEATLGPDHDLTAEKLLASMGLNALMGAGMGGALGIGGGLVAEGAGAVGRGAGRAYDAAAGFVGDLSEAAQVRGRALADKMLEKYGQLTTEEARKAFADKAVDVFGDAAGFLRGKDPEIIKRALREPETLDLLARKAEETLDARAREISKAADIADTADRSLRTKTWGEGKRIQMLEKVPSGNLERIRDEALPMLDSMMEDAIKMTGNNAVYANQARVQKFTNVIEEARKVVQKAHGPEGANEIFSVLDWTKRKMGKLAQPNKFLGVDDAVQIRMRELYDDVLKPHLELDRLYGQAAVAQREINEVAKNAITAAGEYDKRFQTSTPYKDPLDEWMDLRQSDPGKLRSLYESYGTPGTDKAVETLQEHMQRRLDLFKQYKKHYKLDEEGVAALNQGIRAAENALAISKKTASEAGLIQAFKGWEQPGMLGSMAPHLATVGAVVGGIPGAAVGGAAGLALKAVSDPALIVRQYAALERAGSQLGAVKKAVERIDAAVGSNVRSFIRDAVEKAKNAGDAAKETVKSVGRTVDEGATRTRRAVPPAGLRILGDTPEERRKEYLKQRERLSNTVANPRAMAAHTYLEAAPNVQAAMQKKAIMQAQFLLSKMPEAPKRASLQPLLERNRTPSDSEILKWGRYYAGVTDPIGTLKDLGKGQISKEQIEGLKFGNPALYSQIQAELLDQIHTMTAKGVELPYRSRLLLSGFLETPADQSQAEVKAYQSMYQQAPKPPSPRASGKPSRMPSSSASDSLEKGLA